jgi:hypothetical protein
MKPLLILLALLMPALAGLNDPPEARGTIMGAIVDKLENGDILIAAVKVRSKSYLLDDQFYIVITGLPKGTKAYLGEYYKCTGVPAGEREVHSGYRPYPVFKYVAP